MGVLDALPCLQGVLMMMKMCTDEMQVKATEWGVFPWPCVLAVQSVLDPSLRGKHCYSPASSVPPFLSLLWLSSGSPKLGLPSFWDEGMYTVDYSHPFACLPLLFGGRRVTCSLMPQWGMAQRKFCACEYVTFWLQLWLMVLWFFMRLFLHFWSTKYDLLIEG